MAAGAALPLVIQCLELRGIVIISQYRLRDDARIPIIVGGRKDERLHLNIMIRAEQVDLRRGDAVAHVAVHKLEAGVIQAVAFIQNRVVAQHIVIDILRNIFVVGAAVSPVFVGHIP